MLKKSYWIKDVAYIIHLKMHYDKKLDYHCARAHYGEQKFNRGRKVTALNGDVTASRPFSLAWLWNTGIYERNCWRPAERELTGRMACNTRVFSTSWMQPAGNPFRLTAFARLANDNWYIRHYMSTNSTYLSRKRLSRICNVNKPRVVARYECVHK